jgi:hypothetical protein
MKERVEDARWPKSVRMGNTALKTFSKAGSHRTDNFSAIVQ